MGLHTLGRRSHLPSSAYSRPQTAAMLVLGFICIESLLFALAAAVTTVRPDQDQTTFVYNQIERSNRTEVYSTPIKCLIQQPNRLRNETFGDYRLSMSFGNVMYIFAFIVILIVLKSLLTKIMMVENKPEDSEYVMSLCEASAAYKITLQKCTINNNVSLTPPNSPCVSQTLIPPVTSTPVFYAGTRFPLSPLGGGRLYYGERCPFSSPKHSTMSLV